jgi:glycosyltransferase involved in cell wall biosynthesis
MDAAKKLRVAFLNTHPIQYFAPMYKELNRSKNLTVTALYLSDFSVRGGLDRAFDRELKWDLDLLDGYEARFVKGADKRDEPRGFMSVIAPKIWKEVRRGRYNALIVHGHTPIAHIIAVGAAKFARTPVFMRCETHSGLHRSNVKAALRKPLLGAFYRLLDGVLAIGSANAAFYRAMGVPDGRIFLMPYAVDNARFLRGATMNPGERAETRRQLGVDDGAPVILYASKFQRRKRPDDLIHAAARLDQMGAHFHLALVGSGEMESELRALVSQLGLRKARFLGFVNQSALPKIYGASDMFVLPSQDEPWGLAINEAMCAGLPIIASREIGCVPDLVQDGRNGRLFDSGNIEGLVQALSEVLQSPALRKRMGGASHEIISRWGYEQCRIGLCHALESIRFRNSDGGQYADHV